MTETFSLSNEADVAQSQGRFDRSIVDEVWDMTEVINGNDSAIWRKDENGSTICRSEYGNRRSSYGWEIIEASSGNYQLKALHFDNL